MEVLLSLIFEIRKIYRYVGNFYYLMIINGILGKGYLK